MNISISFFWRQTPTEWIWLNQGVLKKMYGQEIDAYEKQESTNHEQYLTNFCLH